MKKIKEILIHWLGGYTEEEYVKDTCDSFEDGLKEGRRIESDEFESKCVDKMEAAKNAGVARGKLIAKVEMLKFAEYLYGLPAEEWCKKMYEYLKKG